MAATIVPQPPWCPTPGTEAYNNPPTCNATGLIVKTRKNNTYYYVFDYYLHGALITMMQLQATMPAAAYGLSPAVLMQ